MVSILLISVDRARSESVSADLQKFRHAVQPLYSIPGGHELRLLCRCDVVLILVEPFQVGYVQLCREFRNENGTTPIIVVLESDNLSERLAFFDAGADECLSEPLDPIVLNAYLETMMRRTYASTAESLPFVVGDLILDPLMHTVDSKRAKVALRPQEFAVLKLLAMHPCRYFTSHEILHRSWQAPSTGSDDTVRTHILALRRKLCAISPEIRIVSKYGLGYMCCPESASC